MGELDDLRVLVVGASRGLGHAFVEGLAERGARVHAVARSRPSFVDSGLAIRTGTCDVRDATSCLDTVAAATDWLNGLDALIYAPGIAVISELRDATPEHWHSVLATNVIGAAVMTAAAVPELERSQGIAVYLSSVSAHVTPPWIGMGLYAASKAALEKTAEVWKLEHPNVRFTTVVVGSTSGGSFFANAEKPRPDDLKRFQEQWHSRGYLAQEQLEPVDHVEMLSAILTSRAQIDTIWVRPRTQLQLPDPEQ
jgi:NAD(P)-dependent dehydrogenase (short-subunit alcohol dehydrogenase family)